MVANVVIAATKIVIVCFVYHVGGDSRPRPAHGASHLGEEPVVIHPW